MNIAVACIGAGSWGKNLVRNFHELNVLASVCDANEETLEGFRKQYPDCKTVRSLEEVFGDPSITAVSIASPAEMHGRMVRQALLAGKDIFVEKPLCLAVDEGKELVELARTRERILMVGHLLWYHPAVLKLKELVKN